MTPEAKIKAKIKKWLKDHGVYYISVIPSPLGGSTGTPDLICCFPPKGLFVGIEVKTPGNQATPLQRHQIQAIKAAGGVAVVVTDVEQMQQFLPLIQSNHASKPETSQAIAASS